MRALILIAFLAACSDDEASEGGACTGPDEDGVVGGTYTFEVEVSDTGFRPAVIKAQNSGTITLTLKNAGTAPHGLDIACLVVQGCTSCFPDASKIAPIAPGAQATATFTAPAEEGIFPVRSPGDAFEGQLILQ
jgi:hypothetical protein